MKIRGHWKRVKQNQLGSKGYSAWLGVLVHWHGFSMVFFLLLSFFPSGVLSNSLPHARSTRDGDCMRTAFTELYVLSGAFSLPIGMPSEEGHTSPFSGVWMGWCWQRYYQLVTILSVSIYWESSLELAVTIIISD